MRNITILVLLLSMAYGECVITGCSSQICAEEPTSSDCVYLDWYVCFQTTECGNYGPEGSCSWELTESFLVCLDSYGIIIGCSDQNACNYNPDAIIDDGSCEYYNPEIMCDCEGSFLDVNGDCCSELIMDECWVCNGSGPEGLHDCDGNCLVELDCAGNCCSLGEEGCYWQEIGPCGEPGPSNGMDSCGVCGGDNTSCADCSGVPCSDAYIDNCGVCDDIPENDCVQGCDGGWGSGVELDECGVCDGDNACFGCTGTSSCNYNPDTTIDDGSCIYPEDGYDCYGNCTGPDYDSDGICDDEDLDDDNDGVIDSEDCAPLFEFASEFDCAGICGGDNSSYDGCCGLPPNDDCTDDCYIDSLGTCCTPEEVDECGVCGGDGSSCQLLGDLNGDGVINVIDIVLAVGLILENNYNQVGDVNEDGLLNVIDVVMLVNWVLNGSGCSEGSSWDYDMDGICDSDDADDDNDGVLDPDDSNDNNEYVCSDVDGDNCDDCSSGTFDPINDGSDYNGNGICDEGEANNDTDGDGMIDDEDYAPYDPYVCSDNDWDTCDDCSTGYYDPADDGWDYDGDGSCDAGDADDDNDGAVDPDDSDDNNEFKCSDNDGDTCDDCSTGHYDTSDDGYDYDGDGQCDAGDCDDDNDGCQECWDYCP